MDDDYIRRRDAITAACKGFCHPGARCPDEPCKEQTKYLRELPPADVVQVVRCKDCKHVYCRIYHGWQEPIYTCTHLRSRWNTDNDLEVNPDDFCSYGEREE